MKSEYIEHTDQIFFKHETSKNLPEHIYSMHTHSQYELIYFLSGDATYVIKDRKYKLKKGDLILIRPFCYHFIQIDSPVAYERYDILFDPQRDGIESALLMEGQAEVIPLAGNPIADQLFRKCDVYREACVGETFERLLGHLLSELFYLIHLFPSTPENGGCAVSPLISQALRYINEHLGEVTDMSQIAAHLFISESYLFRIFKRELHKTPREYITEKRLLRAHQRISMGERPSKVCEELGFGTYSTFYRNYRAYFGHTPAELGRA